MALFALQIPIAFFPEKDILLKPEQRNHNFDLLRLLFATLVILAHAPQMTDGSFAREPLTHLTHTEYNLGSLGVSGFFLLSGYLIVQSWMRDPEIVNYLRKRILRIVPGYVVAALVCTTAIGLLAPAENHFFDSLSYHFPESMLLLGNLATPPVFPGVSFHEINGSLWTIPYEFRCYLLVTLLGLGGILRRRVLLAFLTVALLFVMAFPPWLGPYAWHKMYFLTGEPWPASRLVSTFLVGACFYVYRDRIAFRRTIALVAGIAVLGTLFLLPRFFEPVVVTFGGYLLFYFAQAPLRSLAWTQRMPDISYGVYLYGFPVESLWIWYRRGSPWIAFLATTLIAYGVGWLSWHLVERPMLRLKRKPSAVLPPS